MVKQNIKIALIILLGLITFALILFNFIKLDVTAPVVINFQSQEFIVDTKTAAYIESNNRREVLKMKYENQYLACKLFEPYGEGELRHFPIMMISEVVDQSQSMLNTTLLIDSLNVYNYIFKK